MKLPELTELPKTQYMTYRFAGYNCTPDNSESEFSDMKNMSVDGFPALANRRARGDFSASDGNAINYADADLYFGDDIAGAVYRDGNTIYTRGGNGLIENVTANTDCAQLGTHTVAYDKYTGWMKENDGSSQTGQDISYVWQKVIDDGYAMYVVPVLKSGNEIYIPSNVSSKNSNMDKLLDDAYSQAFYESGEMITIARNTDGSVDHKSLNVIQDGTLQNVWVESDGQGGTVTKTEGVATSYCGVKIAKIMPGPENHAWGDTLDLSQYFVKNEVVTFSNSAMSSPDKLDGAYTIQGFKDEWMIITRFGKCFRDTSAFKIERVIPTFEKVISCENRLWGGTRDGREIYSCQQGQPGHWQVFAGEASDSIALTVGTGGNFTGACAVNGVPMFFKERYLHVVNGNTAQTASVRTIETNGVKSGCSKSVKVINDIAYYVGADGVYCTGGGRSTCISKALGKLNVARAVAGVLNNKYYVCIHEIGNKHTLFVFDVATGLWHKEDDLNVTAMMSYNDDLYMLTPTTIWSVKGSAFDTFSVAPEGPVKWEIESEDIDYATIKAKYVNRMIIKLTLDKGARASVYMKYDNQGEWEQEATLIGIDKLHPQTVWIVPKRCHTYRYKLNGVGDVNIASVTKYFHEGSDIWF